MSTVDKRVVQMVFDNEEFEKNIAKSQKSLESIDKQIGTLGDDLKTENLSKAVTKGMNEAEQIVSAKAEVFRGIMIKIGGYIGDFFVESIGKAQKAINNLTFDQINVGFDKYEKKLANVQTLMNASGESIEGVEERLKELNWYTDETSANFTDMANNIGKFISAGVGLDDATEAMMGISNWAYLSGANLQQASMAMYNFSQAMGTGVMMTQDWKSIENANMATKEFKQTVIETARELYKEGKIQEDVVEAYGVTAENFRSTLKDKWFTTDIMKAATQAYGSYSTYVKEVQEKEIADIDESVRKLYADLNNGKVIKFDTASQTMDYLNFVEKNYKKEIKEIIATNGESSEELSKFVEKLGISTEMAIAMTKDTVTQDGKVVEGYFYEISKKAFLAAQEYKTFADVISATTDAVSTKWMNIFQEIFGNFEEAKALWSEMGDMFYDIFAQPIQDLLDIAEIWNRYSGRKMLFGIAEEGEEIYSIFQLLETTIRDISSAISDAFYVVFPQLRMVDEAGNSLETLGRQLAVATYCIREFIKESAPTEEQLTKINEIAVSLFKILRGIVKVIYSIIRSIKVIVKAITPSLDVVLEALGIVNIYADGIEGTLEILAQSIWRTANFIAYIIEGFKQAIKEGRLKEYLMELGRYLIYDALKNIMTFVNGVTKAFSGVESECSTFAEHIGSIVGTIGRYIYNISTSIIEGLGTAITDFMGSGVTESFMDFLNSMPASLGGILGHVFSIFKNLLVIIENILGAVSSLLAQLSQNKGTKAGATLASIIGLIMIIVEAFLEGVKEGRARAMTKAFTELIEGIGDAFKSFQNAVNAFALSQIAASILMVAISASMLAKIPSQDLRNTMLILTGSLVALVGALAIVTSFSSSSVGNGGLAGILNSLQKVAIAVLIFSNIVLKLMGSDTEQIKQGLRNLFQIFVFIGIFISGLRLVTNPAKGMSEDMYKQQMNTIIAIIKNITWISVAMFILAGSFKMLASLDAGQMTVGCMSMLVVFGIMYKLLHEMRAISNRTNPSGLALVNKTLTNLAFAMLAMSVSIGLIMTAFTAVVAVMGIMPREMMYQGLAGLAVVLLLISVFVGFMRLIIVGIGNNNNTSNTAVFVMNRFALSLILISAALVVLAIAVAGFTASVGALGMLASSGLLEEGIKAILEFFALFGGFALMMKIIMMVNLNFVVESVEFGLFLMACAGAFLVLALGVKLFADAIGKLGEVDDTVYANGMIRLGKIILAIGGVLFIAKLLNNFIDPFTKQTARGNGPGGRQQNASSLTSFGAELLKIGAGLALIAAAITTMMVPIMLLSAFDSEEKYYTGLSRCQEVLWTIFLFLAGLIAVFAGGNALAAHFGSDRGIGGRTTVDETINAQTLFKKKGKKTTKQMAGVGEEIFKMGKALILVAAAINLLLIPIAILGNMGAEDPNVYWKGINGITLIFAMIALLFLAMAPMLQWTSSGTTGPARIWALVGVLAALGLVVWAIVGVMKDIGNYIAEDTVGHEKVVAGIVTIFGILFILAAAMAGLGLIEKHLVGSGTGLLAVAGSIAIVAASVIAIAFAIKMIGEAWAQDGQSMFNGAIALGIAIAVIGGIVALLGSIEKGAPGAALRGAASFAIVVISLATGFVLLGAALLIVQKALEALIKTAENAKDGWESIKEGVSIFSSFIVVVALLLALFGALSQAFNVLPIGAIALAASIFLLALAFYLVVQALVTLSEKWDDIEVMLDKVTTWLQEHTTLWEGIFGAFWKTITDGLTLTIQGVLGGLMGFFEDGLDGLGEAFKKSVDDWMDYYHNHESKTMEFWLGPNGAAYGVLGRYLIYGDTEDLNTISSINKRASQFINEDRLNYFNDVTGERAAFWSTHNGAIRNLSNEDRALINYFDYLISQLGGNTATIDELDQIIQKAADENTTLAKKAGFILTSNGWESSKRTKSYSDLWMLAGGRVVSADGQMTSYEDIWNRYNKAMNDRATWEEEAAAYAEAYSKQPTPNQIWQEEAGAYAEALAANSEEFEKWYEFMVRTGQIDTNNLDMNQILEDYDRYLYNAEDVGMGAGASGDGNVIGDSSTDANYWKSKYGGSVYIPTKQDSDNYNAQIANATKQGTKEGIIDGIWTFVSNMGGDFKDFFYAVFGKDTVDAFANKLGGWANTAGDTALGGISKLVGVSKEDLTDMAFSFFGVDETSEAGKKLKKELEEKGIGGIVSSSVQDISTKMKNGQDFTTAFNSTMEEKGLSFLNMDGNSIYQQFLESSGMKDVFDQGNWDSTLDGLKIDELTEKAKQEMEDAFKDMGLDVDAEDGGVNFAQNYVSGMTDGLDSYNPEEIFKQWGFNTDDFYNLGSDTGLSQATGQIDGYKEAIDKQSKDLFKGTDLGSKYASLTGGSSKSSNTVTRVINGQYIEAAKTLDLVKPIFQEGIFSKKTMASIVDKGKKWGEKLSLFSSVTPKTQDFWDKVDEEGKLFAMANPDTANFWDDVYIEGNKIMTDKFKTNPLAIAAFMTSKMSEKKVEKSIEDGVKTTTTAVKKEQGSKFVSKNSSAATSSSTSAVTTIDKEQAKNKAAQNGYYVDPNGNVYGAKTQAQTGTSAQSAAQSAATSLDYLRSINSYSFYMYEMMQNMQMQMASIDQNTGVIRDNVTEIKTQPKPAVLGEDQVRKVANFTNLALGKAASLTRRGVTS